MEAKTLQSKSANTKYPVIDLIKNRWSPRAFSEKEISEKDLKTILEAGTWAASSMNTQPWRWIYAFRGEDSFEKIHSCLMDGNKPWTEKAAVLMICLAEKEHPNGRKNGHYFHDSGQANAYMMLQAQSMDIYGHMMGGFHKDQTIEEFDVPDNLEPVCFIALGYLGDPEQLSEKNKKSELAERKRKDLDEVSFHGELK